VSPAKTGWLAGFDAASLELADEVSRRLRGHGLRRGDLKEIVGWSTTGIASFFQGRRDPRYRDLLRILAATQTPPAVFFRTLLPLVRSGPAGVPATAFVDAFGKLLVREGLASEGDVEQLRREVLRERRRTAETEKEGKA
jgi:hypothetical protein